MAIEIRPFRVTDTDVLIEILKLNGQYDYSEVEGREAMRRASQCAAAVFLVAEEDARPVGLIRGIHDAARALIHLLSVHPNRQRQGKGQALVAAISAEFRRRGSSGTTVTVSERSAPFWEKIGFARLPVFLMLTNFDGRNP